MIFNFFPLNEWNVSSPNIPMVLVDLLQWL